FIRGKYIATDEGLPEATGQPYHLRIGAFFESSNGRITRITNYYNLAAWMKMVCA
ncbi:MAG: cytosolic protein, partial [Akkermansiaceae bacterium]